MTAHKVINGELYVLLKVNLTLSGFVAVWANHSNPDRIILQPLKTRYTLPKLKP